MLNLIKIENGFTLNENEYLFNPFYSDNGIVDYEIISNNQCHIGVNNGVIFLDLSCSINDNTFENINDFITALYA